MRFFCIVSALIAAMICVSCGDAVKKDSTPILGELFVLPSESDSYNAVQHTQMSTDWINKGLVKREWFDSTDTMLLSLRGGKISFMSVPNSVGDYIMLRDSDILCVPDTIRSSFHIAVSKKKDGLLEKFNSAIRDLKVDGTLDSLLSKYVRQVADAEKHSDSIKIPEFKGAPTVRVGVTGDLPPLDMITADGRPTGFNAALLSAIADKLKCNIELVPISANARVVAIQSGNVDAVFWMRSFSPDEKGMDTDDIGTTASYFGEEYVFLTKDYPVEKIQTLIEGTVEQTR